MYQLTLPSIEALYPDTTCALCGEVYPDDWGYCHTCDPLGVLPPEQEKARPLRGVSPAEEP